MPSHWSVVIEESGRSGSVIYREAAGAIVCPWEFSGGEAVVAVRVGTAAEWLRSHPWTVGRREEILGRIAAEVIRQRAPSCTTRLDESSGWMSVLASPGPGPEPKPPVVGRIAPPPVPAPMRVLAPDPGRAAAQADAVRFVRRLRSLRMIVALVVGLVALIVGAGWWAATSALSVASTASRFGESVRSGTTIATLVHGLEPSMPTLHRDGSKDRFTVGVLLHTADGSRPPRSIDLARGLTSTEMLNSRLLGVDAQRVWFRTTAHGAIDLATDRVLSGAEYARVQTLAPQPTGRITDLATGDRALELLLDTDGPDRASPPSGTVAAEPPTPIFHARYLRATRAGSLLVLPAQPTAAPPLASGVLRIHWTSQYRSGTLRLCRLDPAGNAVWERDLGLARLEEVLPDPERPAFIGTLPAPSGTLPEPVLVIVDAATGTVTTHPLNRR
jgi:hypothetical protein